MKIAIIGNGGVGKALIRLLENKKEKMAEEGLEVELCAHMDSSGAVLDAEGISLKQLIRHNEKNLPMKDFPQIGVAKAGVEEILKMEDLDVLIELTPTNKETGEPGMTHIKRALKKGIHVITANKGPILLAYHQLKELADKNNAQLWIGCTTGGALPSVNGGIMDMAGADITSIEGVLNGTTNFILDEMKSSGCSYETALEKAQAAGIAETDPTLDVEGWDTATKLLILTNVLMKEEKQLSDIRVEGVTKITPADFKVAAEKAGKWKLVGRTEKNDSGLTMTVKPEILLPDHPLYGVDGKNKAVRYTSDTLGDLTLVGGASGLIPAAASVLRDLMNLHRGYRIPNERR
ncbi:MAG: homoserine dehydrogenase [Tindallia sp. MSAO_Bac2]|nr:MAG: homoserine dehydrogenase [Tindallia sp. MSAO_Bac2]